MKKLIAALSVGLLAGLLGIFVYMRLSDTQGGLGSISEQDSIPTEQGDSEGTQSLSDTNIVLDLPATTEELATDTDTEPLDSAEPAPPTAEELRAELELSEDYRASFVHGEKGAEYQRYIVLHDTEGTEDAQSVINWWDSNGNLIAAHFVVNRDGTIMQCVPLDNIAHHAGFGDTGHNELYGVADESRDDKLGTKPIGDWAQDYGMNSHSIGIELCHMSGAQDYPEEQLEALDKLIAYIDAYYGFESTIIDHKMWRSGNSDTSPEFDNYLQNYIEKRTHL